MRAMKNIFPFFLLSAFLLSGCFETEFNFNTEVFNDGSIKRETHIDGRGAHLFKAPQDGGWKSETTQTEGSEALLPATYYHTKAAGRFARGKSVPADYRLDLSQLGEN